MPPASPPSDDLPRFLAGGGVAARAIAAFDWSATGLGELARWPVSLRTLVGLVVRSPIAMLLMHGRDGTMIYNDAYAVILGDRHPRALGMGVRDCWPEAAGFNGDVVERVLGGASLTWRDQPFTLLRNGRSAPCWFTLDYSPALDEADRPFAVMAVVVETTERVLAERAVRSGEIRNRQILDSAIDYAIVALDLDGKVTRWNEGAHRVLGWTEAEILGQDAGCFFTPEDRAIGRPRVEMDRALASGVGNDERWHQRKSGERFWASGEMTAIREDAGEAIGFVKVLRDRTEHYRAAEALRESEGRLRRAQEAGGVGTFTFDLETDQISGTPEFFRIFGLRERALISAADFESLVVPEDVPLRSRASALGTRDAPLDVEYRIRRESDHALRWIARRAEYEHADDGRRVRMVGAVQDITEHKRTLFAAEESAEQFRVLAQALPSQVWTAQPEGLLDWFNDRVYDYSGVDAQAGTLLGHGWAVLVHADDVDAAGTRWAQSLATGSDYETEFRIRRADGAWRWHLVRALPIRAADGAVARWVGTNTDIHERKLAEAESMRDLDRIWSLSQELMLMCDYAGVIATVNPSAQRLLGWTPREMVGRTLAEFVHPDDVDSTAAEVAKLAHGTTTLAFENRYLVKDGSYRRLSWTAVPDGGFIHGIARDVTEQRAAESALRQAQKMEAVGQLTGGIAHDFNNLLQGITGSLNVLQKLVATGRHGELDRFIGSAMNSARRAASLTHRLLAFSRRQPLEPRPVDVNPLVASMEDLLRRTLGERIELALALGERLPPTKCDPNQLESAILNLAINSRDAMPDGGRLVIETEAVTLDALFDGTGQEVQPGDYVCISVTDTGSGMSRDTMAKAFEPFFTTKPIGQGTGLGLSMIYGFARQSEGHARIYSELGVGTTFKLYLPTTAGELLLDEAVADAAAPDASMPAPRVDPEHTVLVVEDEAVVRALVVVVLAELGYRVLEAADGPAGLRALQSAERVDLLVTDVGLPGLNGRQMADAGREHRPALKVLFMTGYAENASFATGFLAPGMSMITKPFSMEALAARVREIVGGY